MKFWCLNDPCTTVSTSMCVESVFSADPRFPSRFFFFLKKEEFQVDRTSWNPISKEIYSTEAKNTCILVFGQQESLEAQ